MSLKKKIRHRFTLEKLKETPDPVGKAQPCNTADGLQHEEPQRWRLLGAHYVGGESWSSTGDGAGEGPGGHPAVCLLHATVDHGYNSWA